MNSISFCTPTTYEGTAYSLEVLTEMVDNYFYLGGIVAVINKNQVGNNQVQYREGNPSCLGTAIKIISYATIIIPLIMFIAKVILRCCCCSYPILNIQPLSPRPRPPLVRPNPPIQQRPPLVRPNPPVQPMPPLVRTNPPIQQRPPIVRPNPPVQPMPPLVRTNPPVQPMPPIVRTNPPVQPMPPIVRFNPPIQPRPPLVRPNPPVQPRPPVGAPPAVNPKQRIEQKLDLTLQAFASFQAKRDEQMAAKQGDPKWVAVASEVNDYFLSVIQKLNANENVPIPMYYHATRNGVDAIAKDKNLRMSGGGAAGAGTYFSTRDEHYSGYGAYTYAVDADAIEPFPASYFRPSNYQYPGGEEVGLWIAVQSDIPVSGVNVSHIAVTDEQSKEALIQKFWEGRNGENFGFYAPVITRAASDWIRQSYTAVHRHPLPPQWVRSNIHLGQIPNHVVETEEQRRPRANFGNF